MRRCAFLFAAFLLAGALLGCSSTQDIPKSKRTRALDAPAGDVVTATDEAVTAEGYTVESVDREAGLVTTAPKSNSVMAAALGGATTTRIQALVREAEGRSRLTLTISYMQSRGAAQDVPMGIPKDDALGRYETWFSRIEKRL